MRPPKPDSYSTPQKHILKEKKGTYFDSRNFFPSTHGIMIITNLVKLIRRQQVEV